MNWLNNLLRKPPAKSPARQPPNRPAAAPKPRADPDELRRALAEAVDEVERARRADQLGCALAASLAAPLPGDAPRVWTSAVCHAADKAVALTWVAQVDGDAWLGEVALHGRFAEVRLAAAQRIQDGVVLEQVARQCRDKDKGVYRHCSDIVRQRRQADERALRTAQLTDALHALLAGAPLSVSRLLDLEAELGALEDGGGAPAQCVALLDQANERLRLEADARRRLQADRTAADALWAQCSGALWPGAAQFDSWCSSLATLAQAHAALADWLASQPAAQAQGASLLQIDSRLSALAAEGACVQACEQFLDAIAGAAVDASMAAAWDALPKPEQAATRQALQARWQALQVPLAAPPLPPAAPEPVPTPRPARIDADAVRGELERLEQALEQGHLAEAEAAAKQIKTTVGSHSLQGSLEARLQRANGRLGELRGWAQWGATKKREQLIASAEALLAGEHGVDHLAVVVPALREEWKRLNSQGPSTKSQWDTFDAALEKAYRPVATVRAQEAARRAQARGDKEALCAQWEAAVAAIDWERADYAALEAQRQQMLGQWRAAPRAGARDERALRKRLDSLIAGMDQRVSAVRGAEVERRAQLISAAEALREVPELRRATTEAKALQERWRSEAGALRLSRGDEQTLWQRFRAACDAVFERRDAERAEQVAQREQRAQAREALLDGFATALAGLDANEIKRALAKFRLDWDGVKAGAAEPADGPERRARELQQQAQRRIDLLRRDRYRARLESMAQQAVSPQGLDAEALAAGLKTRESLLIDLEIALGLPTPDAYAQARRSRQLERLQRRFGGGPAQPPQAEQILSQVYATAAPSDAPLDQRLAAAVRKLVELDAAANRS